VLLKHLRGRWFILIDLNYITRNNLQFKIHLNYVIEGQGALVNEQGEEMPLKAGDFALVNPEGLTQVIQAKSTSIGTKVINPLR